MNIRVYRTLSATNPKGKQFACKLTDSNHIHLVMTLEELVGVVKKLVADELAKTCHDPGAQVTIDFIPFHEMECAFGITTLFCFPFTKKEKKLFWTEFTKEN